MMEKRVITWTISRGENSLYMRTRSLLADAEDREIKISPKALFDQMVRLADKYNNLPTGSIGVGFDCE